jgi:hypothetical protein
VEFHTRPTLVEKDTWSLEDLRPRRGGIVDEWDGIFTNPFVFAYLGTLFVMLKSHRSSTSMYHGTSEKRVLEQLYSC